MTRAWLLVLVVLLACYVPHILYAEWVYEDASMLQGVIAFPTWTRPRPLQYAALALETRWTPSPMLTHAVSVGLHVAVVALTVLLASRLGIGDTGRLYVLIVSAVHPVTVEAVAYAAQQGELLGAMCVLTACVLATGRWWRVPVWFGIVLCLVGAALAKESAAVVMLGLVPLTIAVSASQHRLRPLWAVWWLPAVIAAELIFGGILWYGGLREIANVGGGHLAPATAIQWPDWMLVQGTAAVRTLGLLLVPIGPFTVDYDYDLVPLAMRVLSVVMLGCVALVAWRVRSRWPLGAYALAWILIVIAPRLVVQTPRSYFNDHQAYLLVPAFALFVGSSSARLGEIA